MPNAFSAQFMKSFQKQKRFSNMNHYQSHKNLLFYQSRLKRGLFAEKSKARYIQKVFCISVFVPIT